MLEATESCASLTANEMIRRVIAAADAFAAGAKQHDDMTLSVLRVLVDPCVKDAAQSEAL